MARDVTVLPEHERNALSFPVHTLSKSGRGVDGYRPPRPAAVKVVAEVPFDLRSSAIHKTKTDNSCLYHDDHKERNNVLFRVAERNARKRDTSPRTNLQ